MVRYGVSKAIITLADNNAVTFLMSYKRVEGIGHGRLEFLGGRHEMNESPLQAMVRELEEEELSGTLARLALDQAPAYETVKTMTAHHYLFPLVVDPATIPTLQHCEKESLGLDLVPGGKLQEGKQFTPTTNELIKRLRKKQRTPTWLI